MLKIFNVHFWKYFYTCFYASNLINKERYDKAIKIIVIFLEKKEFATETIYYELGRAYFGKKEYDLAKESFGLSIDYNRRNDIYKANTYFYLGLTYLESEQFEKSIPNFRKSIDIKEKIKFSRDTVISLPNLFYYLGRAYIHLNKLDEAFKIINKGLAYEPNNEALQNALTVLKDLKINNSGRNGDASN